MAKKGRRREKIRAPESEYRDKHGSVLVLRGCGPKGYPGMPEVSNMPLPPKLLAEGVRDMVRVCDGRMSGTAYGTVVLHVSPEAAAGGPLDRIRTGSWGNRACARCRAGCPPRRAGRRILPMTIGPANSRGDLTRSLEFRREEPRRAFVPLFVSFVYFVDQRSALRVRLLFGARAVMVHGFHEVPLYPGRRAAAVVPRLRDMHMCAGAGDDREARLH